MARDCSADVAQVSALVGVSIVLSFQFTDLGVMLRARLALPSSEHPVLVDLFLSITDYQRILQVHHIQEAQARWSPWPAGLWSAVGHVDEVDARA